MWYIDKINGGNMNENNLFDLFGENAKIEGDKIVLKNRLYDAVSVAFKEYHFDILKNITALEKENGVFELIYHLYSTSNAEDLLYSINVSDEIESITDIFKSAIADEREIYDMFGIKFIGHEDLKRLYMPEGWEGYPLRKDYVQDDTRLAWNDNNV